MFFLVRPLLLQKRLNVKSKNCRPAFPKWKAYRTLRHQDISAPRQFGTSTEWCRSVSRHCAPESRQRRCYVSMWSTDDCSAVTGHFGRFWFHRPRHPSRSSWHWLRNQRQCTWLATFLRRRSDTVRRCRHRAFATGTLYIRRATGQCARTVAVRYVHFTDG